MNCKTDISHLHGHSKRCKPCAKEHLRTHSREKYVPKYADRDHLCVDCGTDISHKHGLAERCTPCAEQRRKDRERAERGAKNAGKTCCDCGCDISHRHGRAIRCKPCAASHAALEDVRKAAERRAQKAAERNAKRTCVICAAPTGHLHPHAKTCGDECAAERDRRRTKKYQENNRDKIRADRAERKQSWLHRLRSDLVPRVEDILSRCDQRQAERLCWSILNSPKNDWRDFSRSYAGDELLASYIE